MMFSFGGWNANRMCFKCGATQPGGAAPYTDVSISAIWRSLPLTARGFISEIISRGHALSPLLSLPGFLLDYIIIDVLHCVDLGVAQDATGSFFYEMVHNGNGFLDGTTVEKRVQSLWKMISGFYKQFRTPSRLQALTPEMICKKKAGAKPKLRTKGGEMRHLIPCVVELAQRFHGHVKSVHSKCILDLFSRLLDFYFSIGLEEFDPAVTQTVIQQLCLIYKSLASTPRSCWHLTPKLHLMQELSLAVFTHGDPANDWTYKDEDYMGLISGMGSSRGGARNPTTIPENIFVRISAL